MSNQGLEASSRDITGRPPTRNCLQIRHIVSFSITLSELGGSTHQSHWLSASSIAGALRHRSASLQPSGVVACDVASQFSMPSYRRSYGLRGFSASAMAASWYQPLPQSVLAIGPDLGIPLAAAPSGRLTAAGLLRAGNW